MRDFFCDKRTLINKNFLTLIYYKNKRSIAKVCD